MLLVGLTGGIGSGKSTVLAMLRRRGAVVLDADDLARQAVAAGTPGFDRVTAAFGREVVAGDGELDREELARRVFADEEARRRLESIVHPEVGRRFAEAVEPLRRTDRVVVYAVPLLVESGTRGLFDVVVTVSASEEVRAARLAGDRGMEGSDARRRMAAQARDEEREAVATAVLRNDGSREELEAQVDRLWADLERRAGEAGPA